MVFKTGELKGETIGLSPTFLMKFDVSKLKDMKGSAAEGG